MLMQNLGATNKEHYGMLWYFLEWPIERVVESRIFRNLTWHKKKRLNKPFSLLFAAEAPVNDNLDSYDSEAKCPHNEIMYNVKLMGGLKAGKFTDIGKVKSIKTCIR